MQVRAEIITIGDEILIGQTVDTNSAWMAERLHLQGIRVTRIVSVSDSAEAITQALDQSFAQVPLVLMTGGLGPTQDDLTKQTLADYFGTELEHQEEIYQRIADFFKRRGREMLESNKRQAELPRDADILVNTRGTAMGMWFEKDAKVLLSMPGVPYEMQGIMEEHGLQRIAEKFKTEPIIHKTALTQGIGESFLAEKLRSWEERLRSEGLALAYLPSPGLVKLRVSGYADHGNEAALEARIETYLQELEALVPEHYFGRERATVAQSLGAVLLNKNATLAVAESCTGGYVSHLITSIPGSSGWYRGGVVSYANSVKEALLDVAHGDLENHGAVSEAVVLAMASGARRRLSSDYALATSGVAGPDGGSEEKPVGTVWIAICGPGGAMARSFTFGRSRSRTISVAALTALNWLRTEIISGSLE